MESKNVKVTFNMSSEVLNKLRRLAEDRGTTVTAVVQDAINTELFLHKELDLNRKILIEDESGKTREVVFRR